MRFRTFAEKTVKRLRLTLILMLCLAALCGLLSTKVVINADMTKYLPEFSPMKQGIDVLAEEFPSMQMPSTIRVMLKNVPEDHLREIQDEMSAMPGVDSAALTGSKTAGEDEFTLFTVSTAMEYRTPEELALEKQLKSSFDEYEGVVRNDDTEGMEIPGYLYVMIVAILLVVLFLLCESWVEPFLFLMTIGIAILINMGTNLILGTVSQTTYSMSAILQLVLSMDYSIILMNRYRQERALLSKEQLQSPQALKDAMVRALCAASSSIAGSGLTTFVGLLMLIFMRFQIGRDLGLVLAKGVLCSMLCVLIVLPSLILLCDRLIVRTAKRSLHLSGKKLAARSYRIRYALCIGFIIVFAVSWVMQMHADVSFALQPDDPIADVFPPENSIIVLYANEDEEAAAALADTLGEREDVSKIYSYAASIGSLLNQNKVLSALVEAESRTQLHLISGMLDNAASQLVGTTHSLMIIQSLLPVESDETWQFMDELETSLSDDFKGDYYLIGNTPMAREMEQGFGRELMVISLLTAISIFLVVALTFRNLMIPLALVSLVQCGVFLTITTTMLVGYDMYYLAILIVQCILMGATVDYGILMTNYYREQRETLDVKPALSETLDRSLHTVLTSALFMIFGTGVIAVSPADPTIRQICMSIALGALCAVLLVIFVLPGMLSVLDRLIIKKRK